MEHQALPALFHALLASGLQHLLKLASACAHCDGCASSQEAWHVSAIRAAGGVLSTKQ
jgi:hypothetical protein